MADNLPKQGGKPQGLIGNMLGRVMNYAHTSRYKNYFNKRAIPPGSVVLDIGCGGGKFVKFIAGKINGGKAYGLDHSEAMIKLASRVNQEEINNGQVEIIQGSVAALPFDERKFDFITAFETIQYWPDLPDSLREVFRVIKSPGKFIIINQYPHPGTKWYDRVKIKTHQQYSDLLKRAGFKTAATDLSTKPGWIIITAEKE